MKHKYNTQELFKGSNRFGACASVMLTAFGLAATSAHAGVTSTADGHMTSSAAPAAAGATHDDLAKKLANPIAAMISIPFQNNFDWGGGPSGDGFQWKMNFQPVIPIKLNDHWNLVTRTIIPVIAQNDIIGTSSQSGLSDTTLETWFSPVAPTSNGWILGAGPAFMFPTGTDDLLTQNQWAAGPTAIALRQQGKFTYGALASQLWSYAGDGGRAPVNYTFIEPFFSYIPGGGWTYTIQTETSYDYTGSQWTVPINLEVSKMIKIGKTPTQWMLGARYYAEKPDNGPDWGLRFAVTILIPES